MRTNHLGTAAGAGGVPYEIMSGDIRDVSDRTLRIVIQEFRRLCEQRQWQIIIPMLCQRMVDWWADAVVLKGAFASSELDALKSPKWSPHGWEHIHPVQDPQGKIMEIEAGLRSRADVISKRGDDPDQVREERAAEKKADEDAGLDPPGQLQPPGDPGEPAGEPASGNGGKKSTPVKTKALLQLVQQQMAATNALLTALMEQEA
jgi:capsid protein